MSCNSWGFLRYHPWLSERHLRQYLSTGVPGGGNALQDTDMPQGMKAFQKAHARHRQQPQAQRHSCCKPPRLPAQLEQVHADQLLQVSTQNNAFAFGCCVATAAVTPLFQGHLQETQALVW